jgi:hypothetical protein
LTALRRDPFAWEVQVRREVLDEELAHLRELPYSLWRGMIGREKTKSATGRDGRAYRLKVTAAWAGRDSEDVRVTVTLEKPGLRKQPIQQAFVITPDNQFLD